MRAAFKSPKEKILEYTLIELPIEIFINSQLAYFNFQGLLVWHSFGFDIFVLLRFYLEKTLLKVNKKYLIIWSKVMACVYTHSV